MSASSEDERRIQIQVTSSEFIMQQVEPDGYTEGRRGVQNEKSEETY